MKKTILAALAAFIITSPVNALELPAGLTCSDIFWADKGRVNPKHLSDYQECVLATTQPDKTQGIFNDIAWIKHNGKYYSMALSVLRKSFRNPDKALAALSLYFQIQINKDK